MLQFPQRARQAMNTTEEEHGRMTTSDSLIEAVDLRRGFHTTKAVAGISFSAWRGFRKKGKTDGALLSTELAC